MDAGMRNVIGAIIGPVLRLAGPSEASGQMKPVVLRNSRGATTAAKKSATGEIIAAASKGMVGTEMLVREVAIAGNRGIGSIRHNLGEEIKAALPPSLPRY